MQKISIFFFLIILFFVGGGIFSTLGGSFQWKNIYDNTEYFEKINTHSGTYPKGSFSETLVFSEPRTTFYLSIGVQNDQNIDDLVVEWITEDGSVIQGLDLEYHTPGVPYTTFPYVTLPRRDLTVRLSSTRTDISTLDIDLISADHSARGKKLVFLPPPPTVSADPNLRIISRAEWGADESLRYISPARIAEKKQEWQDRGKTPRIISETLEERDRRLTSDAEYSAIASEDRESSQVYSLKRYEGSQKLLWPIKKSKEVDRIIIHHTAENIDTIADDMTLIRAIYSYHARTKGWGDIGYNYLIGGRGVIYEGRAGGDYVEGAHVYGNNLGTVGISLIGNYDILSVNRDQRAGILLLLEHITRKYGIDLNETDIGVSVCGSTESCIWKKMITPRLIGHRDLAATSCPGKNLYSELESYRKTIVGKVGKIKPVYNPGVSTIDAPDPEDLIEYQIKKDDPPPVAVSPAAKIPSTKILSLGGDMIKVRLSYPHDALTLRSAGYRPGLLTADGKRIPYKQGEILSISKEGKNGLILNLGSRTYRAKQFSLRSDVVEIPSWSRIPSWDTKNRYNDNIFRGKISVTHTDDRLIVVNELPLEDYLLGLGEVSESVDVKYYREKVKALIVAARSYAYYYSRSDLPMAKRKFPTRLYDISDDPDESQSYKGYGYELRSPNYAKLVKQTRGLLIKYDGAVIKPWYSSSSDGKTLSYLEYCAMRGVKTCEDIPYLQSVPDPGATGRSRLGHGVGISGIGATHFALQGWDYKQIIQYYLKGVEISKK